jgi:hypothetical protein
MTKSSRLGLTLILLSGVFFFTMFAVPWFPVGGTAKVAIAAGCYLGMQVSWWVGAAFTGPAAISAVWSRFTRAK